MRNVQVRAPRVRRTFWAIWKAPAILFSWMRPATGAGTWRRNPDAKWRCAPRRHRAAHRGAGRGAARRGRYVKRAGASAYITCSVLRVGERGAGGGFSGANPDSSCPSTWRTRRARRACRNLPGSSQRWGGPAPVSGDRRNGRVLHRPSGEALTPGLAPPLHRKLAGM